MSPSVADGRPAPPKRARKAKPSLEPVAPHAPTAADTRFARALASPDPSTRARALDALTAWLAARPAGGVPRPDMLKLWAGVFYAFWHSDLAPVQRDLAQRIADVVGAVHIKTAATYLDAAFTTLQREWGGIDRLRLDKFMMLVRTLLRVVFATAAAKGFAPKPTARLLAPVAAVLAPDAAAGVAQAGLGLQIADAAAAELAAVADAGGACDGAAAAAAVAPFVAALAATPRPELAARLARSFFGPLAEGVGDGAGGPFAGWRPAALAAAVAAAVAAAAADPATRSRNRAHLFEVGEALEAAAGRARGGKAAPAAPAAAPALAAAPTMPDVPARKAKKAKKRELDGGGGAAAAAAAAAGPATPPTAPRKPVAPAAAAAAPAPSRAAAPPPTKKRVQWALKSNLVHAAGGPVPAPAVRTPPGSQPRGPALKTRAAAAAPARKAGHKRGRP